MRKVREGRSPAIGKQRDKRRLKEAKSFGEFGEKQLTPAPMANGTRAMRRSIFERELLPVWRNRHLTASRDYYKRPRGDGVGLQDLSRRVVPATEISSGGQ